MTLAEATYRDLVSSLDGRPSRERSQLVKGAADKLGVSIQTVYRHLKKLGWSSGRKRRTDAGATLMSEQEAHAVARISAAGVNKRGQANIPVKEARLIAIEQGLLRPEVSYETALRTLNAMGLSKRHQLAAEPGIQRRSLHPNHVWFFDISIGIQWYFRDESGKALGQHRDVGARFYKPDDMRKVRRVIHRYLMVDHRSGAFWVRYYYEAGERAVDVADFLWHAMSDKPMGRSTMPLRGVPRRLVMDQGSANKSGLIRGLLDGLGVTVEYHAPGNAKASGAVESRHNHWQRSFEGRMALKPFDSLDELNRVAGLHCARLNAERPLSRTRHAALLRSPLQIWSGISSEQLRECPPRDLFFDLACDLPKERTLDNRHWISVDGRKFLVRGPNVYAGQKVTFRMAPFTEQGIRIWDDQGRELAGEELVFDDAGFAINGRVHVWDDEEQAGASAPPTPAQDILAELDAGGDLDLDIDDPFDGLEQVVARQRFLAPEGQPWDGEAPTVAEIPMGRLEAKERLADELGPLSELSEADRSWWSAQIGESITPSALEAALDAWRSGSRLVAQTG